MIDVASGARAMLVVLLMTATSAAMAREPLNADEHRAVLAHGPWPPNVSSDPSNRFSGRVDAVALGRALFFNTALSADGGRACATCHQPARHFSDGVALGVGRATLIRNTPTVFNLKANRWYGWGGESDSLWAQSIRPLVNPQEMNTTDASLRWLFREDGRLEKTFRSVTGTASSLRAFPELLADIGKLLAAFQETLWTPASEFDAFRHALSVDDDAAMARFPAAAYRGMRLFVGRGRCSLCHAGPRFSNGEFAEIGIPYFVEGGVDSGRHAGITSALNNPYNLLGVHSDDSSRQSAIAVAHIEPQHRNFGEFKVPSLRGVRHTAPYMHNGSLADLRAVVTHYSTLDTERLHATGQGLLRPLELNDSEIADLVAFLETL